MSAPLIAWSGVSAGYDDARVLHGIDLQVHAGEVLAVLGLSLIHI